MISKTITTNPAPLWGGKKTKQNNPTNNQTKPKQNLGDSAGELLIIY